jgi:vesicle coat complex subunit
LVESQGFIDKLVEMLSDSFPIVVANAVAALSDINEASGGRQLFKVDSQSLTKLLAALNECTEFVFLFFFFLSDI